VATVGTSTSLSELLAWPTEHLTEAAAYWQDTGARSYDVFDRIWRDSRSIDWTGSAAEALGARTFSDKATVGRVHDQLEVAARVARAGASELYAARARLRHAVEDADAAGFDVGEDLSVTDRYVWASAADRSVRQEVADSFAIEIHQRAVQLVGLDQQVAGRVTAAVAGIGDTTFDEPSTHGVQAVDFHAPIPEHPNIEPEPPPGGWSNDPLRRAAEKIAYGHAWRFHAHEFPGLTKDQLADVVEDMFRRSYENPSSLVIGRTEDGVPALYDPKTNTLIIRNPKALDAGTAYRPKNGRLYIDGVDGDPGKVPTRVASIPRGDLQDAFPRTASPGEPRPVEPGVRPAPPPVDRLPPRIGAGPVPPESVPHPVNPPHSHHGPPVFGKNDLPDLDEFTPAP
jgi:hypothetical protein